MNNRLIVVSNRVSVPRSGRQAPGGLATGLISALRRTGGVWFGWNGKVQDGSAPPKVSRTQSENIEYVTMPLTKQHYEKYYAGFANRVLWPLFHLRLNLVDFRHKDLETYYEVNREFATQTQRLLQSENDIIWVHDYHCIKVGEELRELGVANRIGFFLHIPFPAFDVYRAIPNYVDLLLAMLQYDLVGFHTELDRDSFLDSMRRMFEDVRIEGSVIQHSKGTTRVGVYPIGLDLENVREKVPRGRGAGNTKRLAASLGSRKLIIGVDRLDYSKGLAERFRSFEQFLSNNPDHMQEVVYLQIAQPSRNDVPEYKLIKDEVDFLAGKINGRYAAYDKVPLRYMNRGFNRSTILGFLSMSHVGLITPLRDGLNLVAKEYVAAQPEEDPGVLILSRMAGATPELGEGAITVTPYDIDGVANAIERALRMPLAERKERWHTMMKSIAANTIDDWSANFLNDLQTP